MAWLGALVRDINFALQVQSVPVTVTPPGQDPIVTRGIWVTPVSDELPVGSEFVRRDPIRVMALRRDVMDPLSRGAVIVAPEFAGGPDKAWRVDGTERLETDHFRVIVQFDATATADLPDA